MTTIDQIGVEERAAKFTKRSIKNETKLAGLTPELFRFGASSLLTDVTLQIAKMADGNYQSADYFSIG